jgi:beta-1,4-mannosyl-glycoprotein beta-1,4-N-acetylglucosaminyltransferase
MKVYDTFIFYNELNMLKLRLEELDDLVDYHILVEAGRTFTNKSKQLCYNDNKHLDGIEKYAHKIIHLMINNFDDVSNNGNPWNCEFYQRNYVIKYIKDNLNDDDIILHGDVDEIPNTNTIKYMLNNDPIDCPYSVEMDFYYYNFNWKIKTNWYLYLMCKKKDLNVLTLSDYRTKCVPSKVIKNGGWHLSYFMTLDEIKNKINTFSHQEYNNETFNNENWINMCIKMGISIFDKGTSNQFNNLIKKNDQNNLPKTYEKFNGIYKIK